MREYELMTPMQREMLVERLERQIMRMTEEMAKKEEESKKAPDVSGPPPQGGGA